MAMRVLANTANIYFNDENDFRFLTKSYDAGGGTGLSDGNYSGSTMQWTLDGTSGNVIGRGSLTGHNSLTIDNISIDGNKITSSADLNLQPAMGGKVTIGDGGVTDFVSYSTTGDMVFVGGAGLPYGHMYVDGTQAIRVALTLNTPAEVKDDGTTSVNDGWLAGDSHLITFPTGGTEHYITVTKAGVYHITWNLSFKMVTGAANTQVHAGLAVDSTTFIRDKCEGHRTISNNTDTGSMSGTCFIDLPNGNEELSLWMENTTNSNDADVSHGSLTAVMVGGT